MTLILIILVLFLLFGGGYGAYSGAYARPGWSGRNGFGIGTILVIILIVWLLFGGLGGRPYL